MGRTGVRSATPSRRLRAARMSAKVTMTREYILGPPRVGDREMAPLVFAVTLLLMQEPNEDVPSAGPGAPQAANREKPLDTLLRLLTHPFVDNGRRFDAYP